MAEDPDGVAGRKKSGANPFLAKAALHQYHCVRNVTETAREREYRLIAMITARLGAVRNNWAPGDPRWMAQIYDAVRHNRDMWATFMRDLRQPANRLPDAIKNRLIDAGNFSRKQSDAALKDPRIIDRFIAINREVMAALIPHSSPLGDASDLSRLPDRTYF